MFWASPGFRVIPTIRVFESARNVAVRTIASCLLACLALAVTTQEAQAQRPAHYYPARPTFSTYLLYRQFNGTGIPNYYQYVRPAQTFRDFLVRNPPSTQRQQDNSLMTIRNEVTKTIESQLRQRATTGIGQPSIPAQFGETSHFYPRPRPRRR